MTPEHKEAKERIDGLVERQERTGYISETGMLKAMAALLRYVESVEGEKNMTLQATEAECAAHATAPRVSLASMEAKISARYDTTGYNAVHPDGPKMDSLKLLSICILVMHNGFTVIGKSAPASAANFNADLGRKLAYEDAIRQLWPLEGYLLRSQLGQAE